MAVFDLIQEVQARHQNLLMQKKNVVGVAMGYRAEGGQKTDEPAVAVLVQQKEPDAALSETDKVPQEIDGVRTDVVEVGYLQAQTNDIAQLRSRFRPTIPCGVSIAHYKVTAGTVGAVVRDRTTGERFILSNNHVLANANEAMLGEDIVQPAPNDGGARPGDVVATLARFLPLAYVEGDVLPPGPTSEPSPAPAPTPPQPTPQPERSDFVDALVAISNFLARLTGSKKRVSATPAASPTAAPTPARAQNITDNIADCALARPLDPTMFQSQIVNIGAIRDIRPPSLGMSVIKTGRTTGTNASSVTLLNATVSIAYNTSKGTRNARFSGQVICDPFSQGGDSGALVVDQSSNEAVGLLFAGSGLASIFTPISVVLDALNVTLED